MPFHRGLSPPSAPPHCPEQNVIIKSQKKKFEKSVGNCGEFRTFEPKIEKTSI